MVNAEKYRDLIIEIFKTEGMNIGILNNTPYPCALLECSQYFARFKRRDLF